MEQKSNFRRKLIFSTGLSIFILLVSSTASFLSIRKLIEASQLVNHTQDIIITANMSYTDLVESQNNMRGYLYTGRESFISDYKNLKVSAKSYLNKVKQDRKS